MNKENQIRVLAHQKWLNEGCPHGRDVIHWLESEAELTKANQPKTAKKREPMDRSFLPERKIAAKPKTRRI